MKKLGMGIVLVALLAYMFIPRGKEEFVLYGNVDQRQVELAFMDSERIAEVLVEEGDLVEKGQILARQESRRLRDRIAIAEAQEAVAVAALARLENGTRPEEKAQAKARVEVAQADLAYAEKQYQRVLGIFRDSNGKAVRKSELDASLSRRDAARARLQQEQNGLRLAEIGPRQEEIDQARASLVERQKNLAFLRHQLEDAELKSPACSIVNRRLLEVGDMATAQRPVFSLLVVSPKWVRAYVAEPDLGKIYPGMSAYVQSDSFSDEIVGRVGFIASLAEFTPKTVETTELRTALVYEVRIVVDDPDNRLRCGMPVTVMFHKKDKHASTL